VKKLLFPSAGGCRVGLVLRTTLLEGINELLCLSFDRF
jgi:hypothetical protein